MSDYKRLCTPIVQYRKTRCGIEIYDITATTPNTYYKKNFYHSSPEECMILPTIYEAIFFVNKICNNNGHRTKIYSNDFNSKWYNIIFINLDTNQDERYGIPNNFKC